MNRSIFFSVVFFPSVVLAAGEGSAHITDDQRDLIRKLTPDVLANRPLHDRPYCKPLLRAVADGKLDYLQPSVVGVAKNDNALLSKLKPCPSSTIENPYGIPSDGPMRYTVYEPRQDDIVDNVDAPLIVKEEGYLYIEPPAKFQKPPIVAGTVWYYLVDRRSCRHWGTEIHGGLEFPPDSTNRPKQAVNHPHGLIRYNRVVMLYELSPELLGSGGRGRGVNFLNVSRPMTNKTGRYGWTGQCGYAPGNTPGK